MLLYNVKRRVALYVYVYFFFNRIWQKCQDNNDNKTIKVTVAVTLHFVALNVYLSQSKTSEFIAASSVDSLGHTHEYFSKPCVCESEWGTACRWPCSHVVQCGAAGDQWEHSADRLTHTKALCHYRDQTAQGRTLSLLLLPLKKNTTPAPHPSHIQEQSKDQAVSGAISM